MVCLPQRRSEPAAAAAADRDERREHPSFPARSSPSSFGRVPPLPKQIEGEGMFQLCGALAACSIFPGQESWRRRLSRYQVDGAILKGRLRERENDATRR